MISMSSQPNPHRPGWLGPMSMSASVAFAAAAVTSTTYTVHAGAPMLNVSIEKAVTGYYMTSLNDGKMGPYETQLELLSALQDVLEAYLGEDPA